MTGALPSPREPSLPELLDDLDRLIAKSRSTFPGYILVRRSKANEIFSPIYGRLHQLPRREGDVLVYMAAETSIREVEKYITRDRVMTRSIWEECFAYVRRNKAKALIAEMRRKLALFTGLDSSVVP